MDVWTLLDQKKRHGEDTFRECHVDFSIAAAAAHSSFEMSFEMVNITAVPSAMDVDSNDSDVGVNQQVNTAWRLGRRF